MAHLCSERRPPTSTSQAMNFSASSIVSVCTLQHHLRTCTQRDHPRSTFASVTFQQASDMHLQCGRLNEESDSRSL